MIEPAYQDGVEVNYTAADIGAMNLAAWRHWLRVMLVLLLLLSGLQFLPALFGETSVGEAAQHFDWLFVGGVMLALAAFIGGCATIGYVARRLKGRHNRIFLQVKPDGCHYTTDRVAGVIFWPAILRVTATRARLFLFISPGQAFILPRRCFVDPGEFDGWVEMSKTSWENAHSSLRA